MFLDRNLFEFSRQNLVGLQTDIETDNSGVKKRIARPDISYSDWRLRWIGGFPIWGADKTNSLANFYTEAEIDDGQETSVDLLYEIELMQKKISASSPFVPQERQAVFGTGATLREVSSTGLGAGIGPGFTALMHGKSYFSIADSFDRLDSFLNQLPQLSPLVSTKDPCVETADQRVFPHINGIIAVAS